MIKKFIAKNVSDFSWSNIPGELDIFAESIGDEYHSLYELYQHRMALNIALFHAWLQLGFEVIKSKLHHDGTMFEGDYFIVMALLPIGQVSYHYHTKHWDKFDIPVLERAPKYDGHTSLEVLDRLMKQK